MQSNKGNKIILLQKAIIGRVLKLDFSWYFILRYHMSSGINKNRSKN